MAELPDNDPTSEASDNVEPPSLPHGAPSRQSPDEVLPSRSTDERDVGWGDSPGDYDDEWYLAERPPHHG